MTLPSPDSKRLVWVSALTLTVLSTACSVSRRGTGAVSDDRQPMGRSGYLAGAEGVRLFYRIEGHGPDTIVVLHREGWVTLHLKR